MQLQGARQCGASSCKPRAWQHGACSHKGQGDAVHAAARAVQGCECNDDVQIHLLLELLPHLCLLKAGSLGDVVYDYGRVGLEFIGDLVRSQLMGEN